MFATLPTFRPFVTGTLLLLIHSTAEYIFLLRPTLFIATKIGQVNHPRPISAPDLIIILAGELILNSKTLLVPSYNFFACNIL